MKKLFYLLSFLVLFLTCSSSGFAERLEPYLVKSFALQPGGTLKALTHNGNITVIGTDERKASVALLVSDHNGNFKKAAIDKAFEEYYLDIKEENNQLTAAISRKDGEEAKPEDLIISMRIYLPKKTTCELQAAGGEIVINNLKGDAKVLTQGQDLRLCQFTGNLRAASRGGAISLNEAEGSLQLSSSGGSISLKKVAGDIEAFSDGGSITADIRKLGKYLTFETKNGSLKAVIPGNLGLDLDLTGAVVKTNHEAFQGITEGDKIIGSVNGGGIPIKLHSQTGQAELQYRL